MIQTYQFKNQNILEHGLSVRRHYLQIVSDLDNARSDRYEFPEKLIQNWKNLKTQNLYKSSIMSYYQIYHDCGKPECLFIDNEGKQHFPNHAEVSAYTFLDSFDHIKDSAIITKLIKCDMMYHSRPMEEIEKFIECNDLKFCFSLWLTSLAEIYANREMFDEANQVSFKIKYKKLVRVLNKIWSKKDI